MDDEIIFAPYGVDENGEAFTPNPTQQRVLNWVDNVRAGNHKKGGIPVLVLMGGVGSGKTRGFMAPVCEMLFEIPALRALWGRQDLKDLKLSVAEKLDEEIIPKDMIGAVIGPGGKIIQEIQETTGTVITIEEKEEKGIVLISATNKESIDLGLARIKAIVVVPEVGTVYRGKVKSIVSFGAFVEILPGKDGLLHISEIEWRRLNTVDEVLKEGEMVDVKIIDIDNKSGKLKLSRKALLPKPEKK